MNHSWQLFLVLIVFSILIQGFFSMFEMACVSFNKVRLQYYINQKQKRAVWISRLIKNPTYLFGTTLLGVNAAMQFGSECARRFYASVGLSPDWAPITQVIIVLIFAELAPMFAGRRYAENVTMLGIPLVYFSSLVLRPVIYILDFICHFFNYLFGVSSKSGLYLTREELQKAIEERDDFSAEKDFDFILRNIFLLKNKKAKDLMEPLDRVKAVSSDSVVADIRAAMDLKVIPFVPLYHRIGENIVAIAYPRDLLRLPNETRVRTYSRSPWFITEKNSILQILKEFRKNNQSLAVVLNDMGSAVGILTLEAIVDEIFGRKSRWSNSREPLLEKPHKIFVDRSFPGGTKVSDFNVWFHVQLEGENETLEELMEKKLGHKPEKGEMVRVNDFELSLEETSLLSGSTIFIRSIN